MHDDSIRADGTSTYYVAATLSRRQSAHERSVLYSYSVFSVPAVYLPYSEIRLRRRAEHAGMQENFAYLCLQYTVVLIVASLQSSRVIWSRSVVAVILFIFSLLLTRTFTHTHVTSRKFNKDKAHRRRRANFASDARSGARR